MEFGSVWVTYLLSKVGNRLTVVRTEDFTLEPDIQKFASIIQA